MSEIRVLIVEDEPLIAADIEQCLSNINFRVSAIAYDSIDALIALEKNTPDAVLLDINLGCEKDGIDIAEIINAKYRIPFLYLTSHADRHTLARAKTTKPSGYIIKPFDERDLLAGLEIALYNFAQVNNVGNSPLLLASINRHLIQPLSEREFDVLTAIYEGKTNQQMADALYVSVNTIKTHIGNIYFKLEVTSRTAAIARLRAWI